MAGEAVFKYAGAQFGKFGILVDSFTGREEGCPLAPAGAIGDMIAEECIAETVEFGESVRIVSSGYDERQLAMSGLFQACFGEGQQFFFVPHPAVLPRGFEAAGMSETPGREGGSDDLPGQPI